MLPARLVMSTIIAFLFAIPAIADTEPEKIGAARVYHVENDFESARQDLVDAIKGRGMLIAFTSHAKDMLDRTADIADTTRPAYAHAEIILFCKANLSHNVINANPHNIVLCPYGIAIYVLTEQPDTVYFSYREPWTKDKTAIPVQKLLHDIVIEAMEG